MSTNPSPKKPGFDFTPGKDIKWNNGILKYWDSNTVRRRRNNLGFTSCIDKRFDVFFHIRNTPTLHYSDSDIAGTFDKRRITFLLIIVQ